MEETDIIVGILKISKGRCKSIKQFINKSKSPGSAWQHGWVFETLSSEWTPICSGSGQHPSVCRLPFSIHIHGRWGHHYLTLVGTHNRISIWSVEMVTPLGLPHFPRPGHPIYLAPVLFMCLHTSGRFGEGQNSPCMWHSSSSVAKTYYFPSLWLYTLPNVAVISPCIPLLYS